MKRIVVALLLVCMMLLTSCGESKEKANDNTETKWIPFYNSATKSIMLIPIYVPKGE